MNGRKRDAWSREGTSMKLRGWEAGGGGHGQAVVMPRLFMGSLGATRRWQPASGFHPSPPRPTPPPLNGICRKTDTSFAKRPFGTLHILRAAVFLRMQMAFGAIACEHAESLVVDNIQCLASSHSISVALNRVPQRHSSSAVCYFSILVRTEPV